VGALKDHKNPRALATAVNELGLPMVIASGDSDLFEIDFLPRIRDKSLVKLIKIQNDREMALLYNSAGLLLFPSLYEGFGLPPLEAMACGLPVVCSNATSLPEVCGDAALLFSPDNTADMLDKINLCLNNSTMRTSLSEKGLERAGQFNWDDSAGRIFNLIKEVVGW